MTGSIVVNDDGAQTLKTLRLLHPEDALPSRRSFFNEADYPSLFFLMRLRSPEKMGDEFHQKPGVRFVHYRRCKERRILLFPAERCMAIDKVL